MKKNTKEVVDATIFGLAAIVSCIQYYKTGEATIGIIIMLILIRDRL